MGKVVYEMSMSLDGFVAAANVRPGAGLGDGGERLHEWVFHSAEPYNRQIMAGVVDTGAVIVGRTTYNLSNWGADGPVGSVRVPTIVVSHRVPTDLPDGHVYIFVDNIEAAHEAAQKVAGDRQIGVSGANVAQQLIAGGFVDELFIHVVPVLFGDGVRLYDHLGGRHIPLETVDVVRTAEVTHLLYRVVKQ